MLDIVKAVSKWLEEGTMQKKSTLRAEEIESPNISGVATS